MEVFRYNYFEENKLQSSSLLVFALKVIKYKRVYVSFMRAGRQSERS